jgi:hypothetical protein
MASDGRSGVRGDLSKRLAVNILMPLAAFLVAQTVVVMAGAFSLVFHPQAGISLGWGLLFASVGAFGLLVTIWAMQMWARERDRLRERTSQGRSESVDVRRYLMSPLVGNLVMVAAGVYTLAFDSDSGLPAWLSLVFIVLGGIGILVMICSIAIWYRNRDVLSEHEHLRE